jgi:hypothetical protein
LQNQTEYSEARGYNLGIARELGIPAAITFNQLLFWQARAKGDWFYKSYDEMIEELPLSVSTLRRAYDILREAGYIETDLRKVNGAPTMHVRICRIAIMQSVNLTETNESVNLTETNNNKTPIKNDITTTDSKQIEELYELYLNRFIIPTRLKGKFDMTTAAGAAEALTAARARYKLSPKRREAIKHRLKDAGYKLVGAAIVGFSREPWYLGENDRGWIADLQTYICRSYEIIEKGADLYEAQNKERTGR